jgi:hypothetical protein
VTKAVFAATRKGLPARVILWRGRREVAIFIAMSDVTRILSQIEQGDPQAAGGLVNREWRCKT